MRFITAACSIIMTSASFGRWCAQMPSCDSKSSATTPHCLRNAPVSGVSLGGPLTLPGPKHDCVMLLFVRLYVAGHGGKSRLGISGSCVASAPPAGADPVTVSSASSGTIVPGAALLFKNVHVYTGWAQRPARNGGSASRCEREGASQYRVSPMYGEYPVYPPCLYRIGARARRVVSPPTRKGTTRKGAQRARPRPRARPLAPRWLIMHHHPRGAASQEGPVPYSFDTSWNLARGVPDR